MKQIPLLVSVCLLLCCCDGNQQPATALAPTLEVSSNIVAIAPDSPKLQLIRVEPVKMEVIASGEVTAPGKIEANPNRIARVSLPVAGKVVQVLVKLGDSVSANQPLLVIESPDADAAMAAFLQSIANVNQANAALIQAQASLSKANNSERKAQADYDRAVDLFEHNAIAQKEALNAENDLKQAKAEVETAKAAVEQAKAIIEHAKAAREQAQRHITTLGLQPGDSKPKLVVRAPLAGKVLEIGIVAGEYRNDTTAPVMTIADLRSVWVGSEVPENSIRLISIGETVDITFDAFPDEIFHGRVMRIADTLDPKTRTIKVMIELPNPKGRLRPEMFGRIRHLEAVKPTLALPVGAIVQEDGRNLVYVEQSKGRFEMREVVTGNRVGDLVAIISGVSEGERVVVDGVMLLRTGESNEARPSPHRAIAGRTEN